MTAGNFIDLVNKGFYNEMKIQRSDGFVVQTGDPSQEGRGKEVGFVPQGSDKVRNPSPNPNPNPEPQSQPQPLTPTPNPNPNP